MAICPAGHQTTQTDFCDTCGLPVPAGQPDLTLTEPPTAGPVVAPPVVCPNCQTANVADALFCEACGYDFTTGALPEPAEAPTASAWSPGAAESPPELVNPPGPAGELVAPESLASIEPGEPAAEAEATPPPDDADETAPEAEASVPETEAPAPEVETEAPAPDAEPGPDPAAEAVPAGPSPDAGATEAAAVFVAPVRPVVEWVAELWIDPDWYAAQGSTDPMPSPGLPDIVPLVKEGNLIGRVSHSRGIYPDVDCEIDTGCSRKHAMLSTDGTRWWIEDLDSANGTFVGAAAGPLPAMPIPRGRVELTPGQRIYVGAWTRIVIRRATDDEQEAFAG